MARTMRDCLKTASARLRDAGHTDSADAVDAVLAPGGWTLLREQDAAFTTNLPLTVRKSLKDALKKAADDQNVTLTAVVTEGHRAVLDGTWTPPESRRIVRRGASAATDPRAVLNVTVDDSLRKELRERLPALSEELGYSKPLTEGGIAIAYLRYKLNVADSKPVSGEAE